MKPNTLYTIVMIVAFSVLSACESGDSGSESNFTGTSQEALADTSAYVSGSRWASSLKPCALAKNEGDACSLNRLPLIGMENTQPSVADILDRTLVSHEWMGQRLEELLTTLPDEILLLTRSLTAIVIDDDIRPAYYDVNTGAIYIDPNFLWLTVEEARTINPQDDFRSEFTRPLNFRSFFRYVKDDEQAYIFRSPDQATERSLTDIEYLFASLFIHELAHANDFFPSSTHAQINADQKPWPAASSQRDDWVATRLANSQSLASQTMLGLAKVMYLGETASESQIALSAAEVGSEFEPDGAADTYGYSTSREDLAMLFEEAMMYHLFGVERDLAFVSASSNESPTCNDYQIGWGSRMRVATSQVSTRAQFVVEQIIPELDSQALFSTLPETRSLPDNTDWCTSVGFEGPDAEAALQKPHLNHPHTHTSRMVEPMPFYR